MCNIFNSLRMKKKIEVEEQKMNLMQTLGIKTITLPKKKLWKNYNFQISRMKINLDQISRMKQL